MNENLPESKDTIRTKKFYFTLGILEVFNLVSFLNLKVAGTFIFNFDTDITENLFYILNMLLTLALTISYFKMKPKWCGIIFLARSIRLSATLISDVLKGEAELSSVATVLSIIILSLLAYGFLSQKEINHCLFYSLIITLTVLNTILASISDILEAISAQKLIVAITLALSLFFNLALSLAEKILLSKIIFYEKRQHKDI